MSLVRYMWSIRTCRPRHHLCSSLGCARQIRALSHISLQADSECYAKSSLRIGLVRTLFLNSQEEMAEMVAGEIPIDRHKEEMLNLVRKW